MKDESLTLRGWPAVPVIIMLVATNGLTALVMALPITWLVNRVFAASAIHAIFARDQFGYWQRVVCSRSGLRPPRASSGE